MNTAGTANSSATAPASPPDLPTLGGFELDEPIRRRTAARPSRDTAPRTLAAVRVHPRGDERARRQPDAARSAPSASSAETPTIATAVHEREPLNGRDADAQPGERSRPDATANRSTSASATLRARERARASRRAAARRACASRRRAARRRRGRRRRAPRFRRASSCRGPAHASLVQHSPHGFRLIVSDMSASATPAMRQYLDAKQQHRDAILLFRMGDFYEMFYEDALVAARALELTLTSRSKDANGGGIPMCGVPFHAVDGYIARLVKKGFRVAICDQVEDPRKAKGLVKREVVRVVSPGTLTDANYLDAREPAFLMADRAGAARRAGTTIGVALLDLSTGEFTRRRIQRRRRPAGARRRARGAASRARSSCRPSDNGATGAAARAIAASRPADDARRRLDLRAGVRARARCSISCAPAASKASASTASRPRSRPPARSCTTCAARRRSTSRTCASIAYRAARRRAAHRSDDAEASRDRRGVRGRPRRVAARRARSHGDVDGQPAAPRRGCCARSSRSSRSAIGSTPSKSSRSAPPSAASFATRSRRCRISSGWSRARRSAPPARATSSASKHSLTVVPRVRTRARRAAGAARAVAARRARRSRRRPRRDRRGARRRSAGAGARRRLHARRRRRRARRAARRSAARASRSSPRWRSASARAPASPR